MADNGIIEVEGLEERIKKMGEASTKNPMMRKRINEAIKQTLSAVRKTMQQDARSGLQMQSDPRRAYLAVRSAVYRRIFGGNINILQPRKAGALKEYTPQRKLREGQRGGNRRLRSLETIRRQSYQGRDRGFILRFLNDGTGDRKIRFTSVNDRTEVKRGSRGGDLQKYGKTINTGSRGSIGARNWFGQKSQGELERAAQQLDDIIDNIVAGILY